MIGMFKSIGKEYAKRGVTANCVAPGFIATPMTDKLNDKQREAILQMVPAGDSAPAPMSRGGGLSGLRRGRLCHRPDTARERGDGYDLTVGRGHCNAPSGWLVKAFEVCYPSKSLAGKTVWARATCGPLATVLIHPVLHGQARDALSRGR